jgi:hypothetical protein
LVSQPPDALDGIGSVPDVTAQTAQPFRGSRCPASENERIVPDLNAQAITGLYAESLARFAWYRDLVLGTDLRA